jgi:uncharacterized membrane protein SirB2
MFEWLKLTHVSCALISIGGFAMRGYWRLSGNPLREHRLARVLPHLVDTLLLGSAVAMLMVWNLSPLQLPWVMAKIVALLLYIGLGMVVMRFATTVRGQVLAYALALSTAGYIVSVAYTKSALGALVTIAG